MVLKDNASNAAQIVGPLAWAIRSFDALTNDKDEESEGAGSFVDAVDGRSSNNTATVLKLGLGSLRVRAFAAPAKGKDGPRLPRFPGSLAEMPSRTCRVRSCTDVLWYEYRGTPDASQIGLTAIRSTIVLRVLCEQYHGRLTAPSH